MRPWVLAASIGWLATLSACRGEPFRSCEEANGTCGEGRETPTSEPSTAEATGETATSGEPPNGSALPVPSNAPDSDSSQTGATSVDAPSAGETSSDGPAKPSPPQPTPPERPPAPPGPSVSTDPDRSVEPPSPPVYGPSLITNGSFDDRGAHWSVDGPGLIANVDYSSDRVCVTGALRSYVILGWPSEPSDSLDLPAGRYRFSFRARGRSGWLWAKVGYAYEPYDTLFEAEWRGEDSEWHDVVHEFTLAGSDAVGLAFGINFEGNTICLDDIELRAEVTGGEGPGVEQPGVEPGTESTPDAGN
jgi:hypothetical protein